MEDIQRIAEQAHQDFEARTQARDKALTLCRQLTRNAAHAIRAIHRGESELAQQHLDQCQTLYEVIRQELQLYPDLFYSGYTQDAAKEYCEASITVALIENRTPPDPTILKMEYATYLKGLSETPGELRRRCLDILRKGYSHEAERLLDTMDEIYNILVTMDYPDAITNGLRRQTDLVRGIVERTRGDLTISLREESLKTALEKTQQQINLLIENNAANPRI
jgi:translin